MKSIARSLMRAVWAGMGLNPFVYNACIRKRVKRPDIPVGMIELFGQCGEDLIVKSLLLAIAKTNNLDLRSERYLEIGGNHPFATSATYLLHRQLGMTGVIVEANKKLIQALKKGRPADTIIHAAVYDDDVGTVGFSISNQSEISSLSRDFVAKWRDGSVGEAAYVEVPAERINNIIANHMGRRPPIFISIDVEGFDLRIIKDLDLKNFGPWILQAEPSDGFIPGNSDEMIRYMQSVGYRLIAATKVNLIFCR